MQSLLEELHQAKDKKSVQQWTSRFERELDRLDQGQQKFYQLLLAEVYAVNLRNLNKAQQCLKQIDLSNQLIVYEHRLRLCYFRFLQGDYDEAITDLNLIKVTIENSTHSRKIANRFFKRMVKRREEDPLDQQRSERIENRIQDYEFELIKALELQRNNSIDNAKRSHIAIYNNFGDISPSIKYEAAKHLLLLQTKSKGKPLSNKKQYEQIVASFQKTIAHKDYYYKKVQFLNLVLDILEESEEDETVINYELIRNYVLDMIDKNVNIIKDNTTKAKLKQLKTDLQEETQLNRQICYNFIGQKVYKQLIKAQQQQKSKFSKPKPKQSALKAPKIDYQVDKVQKIGKTASIMQNVSLADDFSGSYMTKINMNSGGFEQRYFYIKQDFIKSKKLFYCSKKGKEDEDDDSYRLKGFKKIQFGKKSKALNRKQCQEFDQTHCFTLKIEGQDVYQRNFYVKEQEDLKNWIALFSMLMHQKNTSNVKKTVLI